MGKISDAFKARKKRLHDRQQRVLEERERSVVDTFIDYYHIPKGPDEPALRKKYPALQDAWEQYQILLKFYSNAE
jgi:hypothetical protein